MTESVKLTCLSACFISIFLTFHHILQAHLSSRHNNSCDPLQQSMIEKHKTTAAAFIMTRAPLVSDLQKLQGAAQAGCQIDCPVCVLTFGNGRKIKAGKDGSDAEGGCF